MPVAITMYSLGYGIFLMTLSVQNLPGSVKAQIWQPKIDLYVNNNFFHYNGRRSPTFSKWPGNLFLNYSFIKVGDIVS